MDFDELHRPLGLERSGERSRFAGAPWGRIAVGGLALTAAGLGAFLWVTDDGSGGRPFAVAKIEDRDRAPPRTATAPVAPPDEDRVATVRPRASGEEVEEASGVKVIRQGGGAAPGALVIRVPDALDVGLAPAPDRRLVEKGRHGTLPRVGADGARPMDVYARPVMTSSTLKPGAPRVALFVGGMGLDAAGTREAVAALPKPVTLGFAPYGADLPAQVAHARAQGHEVLLQAPMEGFGGAQEEPGPNVLRTADAQAENLDRLRWHMSRFPGYSGVAGFLGGRFTSERRALTPVLGEIGQRGLFYFDDGASPRSVAETVAGEANVPFVRADVVLDTRLDAVDAALARLERLARERGEAVGSASGLPIVVEKVARFAKALEARGVALTPLSAHVTAQRGRPSAARAAP